VADGFLVFWAVFGELQKTPLFFHQYFSRINREYSQKQTINRHPMTFHRPFCPHNEIKANPWHFLRGGEALSSKVY
jgi:hypothetical protein